MSMLGNLSENFKTFEQSWEYYVTAIGLSETSEEIQAAALCSVLGPECVKTMNILTTLPAAIRD